MAFLDLGDASGLRLAAARHYPSVDHDGLVKLAAEIVADHVAIAGNPIVDAHTDHRARGDGERGGHRLVRLRLGLLFRLAVRQDRGLLLVRRGRLPLVRRSLIHFSLRFCVGLLPIRRGRLVLRLRIGLGLRLRFLRWRSLVLILRILLRARGQRKGAEDERQGRGGLQLHQNPNLPFRCFGGHGSFSWLLISRHPPAPEPRGQTH